MTALTAGPTIDVAALYAEHHGALVAWLRPRVGEAAEDVAQDVWVKVWRGQATYRPSAGTPRQWLFGCAANQVVDHYRATARRPSTVDDADLALERAADPTDVAEQVVATVEATEVLAGLPPRQREMLARRYGVGQPVAEVAAAMDMPAGTVKSGCARALRALRTALDVVAPIRERPAAEPVVEAHETPAPEPVPVEEAACATPRHRPHRDRHPARHHRRAARVACAPPGRRETGPAPGGRHRLAAGRAGRRPAATAGPRHRAALAHLRCAAADNAAPRADFLQHPNRQGGDHPMIPTPDWILHLGYALFFLGLLTLAGMAWASRKVPAPVYQSPYATETHYAIGRLVIADRQLREDGPTEPLPPRDLFPPEPVPVPPSRGEDDWATEFADTFPAFAEILRETYERVGAA